LGRVAKRRVERVGRVLFDAPREEVGEGEREEEREGVMFWGLSPQTKKCWLRPCTSRQNLRSVAFICLRYDTIIYDDFNVRSEAHK